MPLNWGYKMTPKERAAIVGPFARRHNGVYVYADGALGSNPAGAQCVNAANMWCEHIGIAPFPGNAGEFVYESHPDCLYIANTPHDVPLRGAIVVWGESPNMPFGHVDVCIWSVVEMFMGFDQNFPLGSPCHIQLHDYVGVAGWFMPRKLV